MDQADVQSALAGVSYPASKSDLLERARDNDADDEVLKLLDRLPPLTFASPTEVTSQLTGAS